MLGKLHRETLAEQAEFSILNFIQEQNLKPGDVLPSEATLVAEFGVSRQVIREALKSLQGKGIITITNGKGAIIQPLSSHMLSIFFERATQIDRDTIIQLIEVRKGIEIQSAMLAAERRTSDELAQMTEIVAKMREQINNLDAYIELDVALHQAIASATHNTIMFHLIDSIRKASKDTIREGLLHRRTFEELERVQEMHEHLLEALKNSDANGAGRWMAIHFDEAIFALASYGDPHMQARD